MDALVTSHAPPRIAIIGLGRNSYTNANVTSALARAFGDFEIDWIDAHALLSEQTHGTAPFASSLRAITEFPGDIASRVRGAWSRRGWTTYLFTLRSRVAREQIAARPYTFSLQIQSNFDAAVPGVPHYVYTDNTILANTDPTAGDAEYIPVTPAWVALERRLYHNARSCFVMSTNVARSLVDDYQCDRARVVCAYGGPNAPIDPPDGIVRDGKNVLFVGVDWIRKGGPALVEAFRLVRERVPDATLTIAGASPRVTVPGVRVVGRVAPGELAQHYARASIFCLPTRREPFGIVFLEAMAYGLPIVSTAISAVPDFVVDGDNGYLVAPDDVPALADRLVALSRSPDLQHRMGERSRDRSRRYRWENTAAIMRTTIESGCAPA